MVDRPATISTLVTVAAGQSFNTSYTPTAVGNATKIFDADSALTDTFLSESDDPTKLYLDKSLGHTRANYNEDIEMTIDHYEKCADFSFPVVGPRSF